MSILPLGLSGFVVGFATQVAPDVVGILDMVRIAMRRFHLRVGQAWPVGFYCLSFRGRVMFGLVAESCHRLTAQPPVEAWVLQGDLDSDFSSSCWLASYRSKLGKLKYRPETISTVSSVPAKTLRVKAYMDDDASHRRSRDCYQAMMTIHCACPHYRILTTGSTA